MKCPDDYRVVMIRFPGDVLAAVRVDADGYPTVYINDALSMPARREALRHELQHIRRGDFCNHLTIYDVENGTCATAQLTALPRSFRPLTDEEEAKLMLVGLQLTVDAFGEFQCTEPLPMPSPLFDIQPETYANRKKEVW